MANPEIKPMLQSLGWTYSGDLSGDGEIDLSDHALFAECINGPEVSTAPPGCAPAQFLDADLDGDSDVDLGDFAVFEQLFGTL